VMPNRATSVKVALTFRVLVAGMTKPGKIIIVLFFPLITALFINFPVIASDDHEEARRLQQAGSILPLETILQKAKAIHPGRVLEVELETKHGQHQYEIELLDENGRVWEMKLNAQTGQLLKQEQED